MKIKRLDGRYTANKQWGYTWQIEFRGSNWKKYFAFKDQAKAMFGPSTETVRRFIWREDVALLKSAPWAHHYEKSSKPMYVYFRNRTEMDQCIMMFALTQTN